MTASFQKISPKEWKTSDWSGGQTNEILIYPANGDFAARQFIWRLSSATVNSEESVFTSLPGFCRFISTLDKPITLDHGAEPFVLYPGAVHYFTGGEPTHSIGTCSDFNLIYDPARCDAHVQALSFSGNVGVFLESVAGRGRVSENATYILFCKAGECTLKDTGILLKAHDTLLMTETDADRIQLSADRHCEMFFIRVECHT